MFPEYKKEQKIGRTTPEIAREGSFVERKFSVSFSRDLFCSSLVIDQNETKKLVIFLCIS